MKQNTTRPFGDIVVHEWDLCRALGQSAAQQTPALTAIRDQFVQQFGDSVDELKPAALVGDSWTWMSRGEPDDAHGVVAAPDFDLTETFR